MSPFRIAFPVVLFSCLLGLGACSGGDDGPPDPPDNPEGVNVEVLRPPQLTEDAFMPEGDPALIDVEVTNDGLAFIYSTAPDRAPAVGDVVSGTRSGGYLRRIVAISTPEATRVEATTEHATLEELMSDVHFIATFTPATDTWMEAGRSQQALTGAGALNFFPLSASFGPCEGAAAFSSLEIKPTAGIRPTFIVEVDINFFSPNTFRFEVGGDMDASLDIQAAWNASVTCSYDLLSLFPSGSVPKLEYTSVFAVGPVPVVVTHTLEPKASVSLGVSGEAGISAKASGSFGIRVGASYDGTRWNGIGSATETHDFSLTPTMPASWSANAKIGAGVEYKMKLYDVFGPTMSFGPALEGKLSGTADSCDYTGTLDAVLAGSIGATLEVPFIDLTVAEVSLDVELYRSQLAMTTGTLPGCANCPMECDGRAPNESFCVDSFTVGTCTAGDDGCLRRTTTDCTGEEMCAADAASMTAMCTSACVDDPRCAGRADNDSFCDGDELVRCSMNIDGCLFETTTNCTTGGGVCDPDVPECDYPMGDSQILMATVTRARRVSGPTGSGLAPTPGGVAVVVRDTTMATLGKFMKLSPTTEIFEGVVFDSRPPALGDIRMQTATQDVTASFDATTNTFGFTGIDGVQPAHDLPIDTMTVTMTDGTSTVTESVVAPNMTFTPNAVLQGSGIDGMEVVLPDGRFDGVNVLVTLTGSAMAGEAGLSRTIMASDMTLMGADRRIELTSASERAAYAARGLTPSRVVITIFRQVIANGFFVNWPVTVRIGQVIDIPVGDLDAPPNPCDALVGTMCATGPRLVLLSTQADAITMHDPVDGTYLGDLITSSRSYDGFWDVAQGDDGCLYVSAQSSGFGFDDGIWRWDTDGTAIDPGNMPFVDITQAMNGASTSFVPRGVEWRGGDLYAANSAGGVQRFDSMGMFVSDFVATTDGRMNDLTFLGDGSLVVTDNAPSSGSDRLLRVPAGGGAPSVIVSDRATPYQVVPDFDGDLLLADFGRFGVFELDVSGTPGRSRVFISGTNPRGIFPLLDGRWLVAGRNLGVSIVDADDQTAPVVATPVTTSNARYISYACLP